MKKVLVIGAGESGVGAALLAKKQGCQVLVSDRGAISNALTELLDEQGITWEQNGHEQAETYQPDVVVKSPGVPPTAPLVVELKNAGAEIIDEIEWAYRFKKPGSRVIAITGSNGKTTTTLLCHHVMKTGGVNVGLAGNIGASWARQLAEGKDADVWVLELSSFQLEGLTQFRADIGIITNITPDHLDRYPSYQHYVDTKLKLAQLTTGHVLYWNGDKDMEAGLLKLNLTATLCAYGNKENGALAFEESNTLLINYKEQLSMSIEELALTGKHNLANSMAAGLAGRIMDLRKESIRASLESFENVEHRLEFVSAVHGIEFVNDSKSTNVNAAWYALDSATKPLVWIAGGVDKGNDYDTLLELAKEKVKVLVVLGKDNAKIKEAFRSEVPVILEASSMQEAVVLAYEYASKGDQVLLSPVCASFDLFDNYEDRGNQFKACVRSL